MMKNWFVAIALVFVAGGSLLAVAMPQTASAACNSGFLGFPAWYDGLTDSSCNIKSPDEAGGLSNFIWHIVLNVIEDAMVLVGYVTVFFILYGGFKFLTSEGDPGMAAKARTTIMNAVVGLVISLVAIGAINFIMAGLGV